MFVNFQEFAKIVILKIKTMVEQVKIGNILFLDIETVPAYPSLEQVPEPYRMLWEKKAAYLKKESDNPEARNTAIEEACNCPSGRLVVRDRKTGDVIEPELEKSIALIEYPAQDEQGPLWIRGGIPVVSAQGKPYMVRNRVTLCRCGKSRNKPFCDGRHINQ